MPNPRALIILFVPLLCLSSESMSGFALCLAKDLGYHFSSVARSQILETPKIELCSYQGSDTGSLNNGFCFTVAWIELFVAAY